jgi:signal peptidase I
MNDKDHRSAAAADLETPPEGTAHVKRPAKKDSWFEIVKTVIYALLIAGVIRSFLFQPFNIPSASMESTLLIGDYLFVSKYSYGFSRHSFPFSLCFRSVCPPISGRFLARYPERGDVVVFKWPPDDSTDYIKRVVGLPGDRIQVTGGLLSINGRVVPREEVEPFVEIGYTGEEVRVPRYRETLPNGVSYEVLDRQPNGDLDNTGVFIVPEGHFFMMGDNRDDSDDSRRGVGNVPLENLVGKAQVIFFSTDGSARLWEIWKWPMAIRYWRLAQGVD